MQLLFYTGITQLPVSQGGLYLILILHILPLVYHFIIEIASSTETHSANLFGHIISL